MFKFRFRKKYRDYLINPDDIFMDTANISNLNMQQFEGVAEKPIKKRAILLFGFFAALIFIIFLLRIYGLQIKNGAHYSELARNNSLRTNPIFSERGLIYDRNGIELAWNKQDDLAEEDFLYRQYTDLPGIGHVLGYVKYPQKDEKGFYWRKEISGQAGLESLYNTELEGFNGSVLLEVDALGNIVSQNKIHAAQAGQNLHTTIDARVQSSLYSAIEAGAKRSQFNAGAGVIMDIHSGEILSFTSYPEFDPYTLAEGEDEELINSFFNDPRKPFLNRLTKGLYSPGSIVKPFLALAALHEDLITEHTTMMSMGRIEIPNRYNPNNPSIFRDWRREGHGMTDVRFAIADSVNTFFYAIGGGYKNQSGLGITKIETYLRDFGLSEKTNISFGSELEGTIPNPEWKEERFQDGTWRLGDTYNTSIGQFGFQVTPIQVVRSVAALANMGTLVTPILVEGESEKIQVNTEISEKDYRIIHAGMRDTVKKGTAQNLNVSYVDFALKTGTAQVGRNNEFYNSWATGFFPYEDPQYAFAVVMERAPETSTGSASSIMRVFADDVYNNYPEFWDSL